MGSMRQGYDRNRGNMCDRCGSSDRDRYQENLKYPHVEEMSLAMAYVPWQEWRCIYDGNKGLEAGTIFQELDMPFLGSTCGLRRGDKA